MPGVSLEGIGWHTSCNTAMAVFVLPSGEAFLEEVELLDHRGRPIPCCPPNYSPSWELYTTRGRRH